MKKTRYTHGPSTRPPKGFQRTLQIDGREVVIRYFKWIKNKEGKLLDGAGDPNLGSLWIATHDEEGTRCCREHLADTIWHEVKHWNLRYAGRKHGKDLLPDSIEEQFVLAEEKGDGSLMRTNPWFWRLYGE